MSVLERSAESNYVLIGLPHSGKSTFIAALWYIVDSEELENSLTITELPEDREYLNALKDEWLSCKAFERTKTEHQYKISLNVYDRLIDVKTILQFPDVSGEIYNMQFEQRKVNVEYLNMIQSANGIILFINPDYLKEPILITAIDTCIGNTTTPTEISQLKPWIHKDSPTQIVLVDLLQMIAFNISTPIKVAVVVSAWDVVLNSQKITPSKWIETTLPLLYQFLDSNKSLFKHIYFGISAQGGKYSEDNTELQLKLPSDRIILQKDNEISKDITLPIKWLMHDE